MTKNIRGDLMNNSSAINLHNNINRKARKIAFQKKRTTIVNAIKLFPNYLYLKGKPNSTIKAYMKDMEHFKTFMNERFKSIRYVREITNNELKAYKEFLIMKCKSKALTSNTIKRRYNALKTFFRYLYEENYIDTNLLKGDNFGNKRYGNVDDGTFDINYLPGYLVEEELDYLAEIIEEHGGRDKYRDLAIFSCLRYLGCRRSEALNLKWTDVNFLNKTIEIKRPKSKNADVLLMNDELEKALLDYKEALGPNSIDYIFVSRQGNRWSETAFNNRFRKYVKLSGLEKNKDFKITPHTLRHSFITLAVENDINIEKITRYTGHRDPKSLDVYTHLKINDLKDVANMFGKYKKNKLH